MPSIEPDAAQGRIAEVEVANFVWEEYKYRHDLIWRLLFRMTAAATVLSIVPFTVSDDAKKAVGGWVDALPVFGLALIAVSYVFLLFEFKLFQPINDTYVRAQDRAVGEPVRPEVTGDWFERLVRFYPPILSIVVLTIAYVVTWSIPWP